MAVFPFGGTAVAADPAITVDVPIDLELSGAEGVNLNIRLDPLHVLKAEAVRLSPELSGTATVAYNQTNEKLKVGIAASAPMTYSGTVFYLRLTLSEEWNGIDELYKLLQIKINEKITWQASDCVILSGVEDGGAYNHDVYPGANEGDIFINGKIFMGGGQISDEGDYEMKVTDLNGKTRTVHFTVDKTAPIIEIVPFDTKPTPAPFTVYAKVNEGVLNTESCVFEDNGSFTFTATDAAGNRSELTVTVSHLRDFLPGDVNGDDIVDSADAIHLLYNVFFGDEDYPINQSGDFDGNGSLESADAIYLLYNAFFGDEDYPLY